LPQRFLVIGNVMLFHERQKISRRVTRQC
jgi:hypothetical protein